MSKRRSISLILWLLLALPGWATFPAVQDVDTFSACQTSNSSSWTLTYPLNVASGNLLLGFMGIDGDPTTTWPAGWSKVAEYASGTASRMVVARKFATGSESGNFTVSLSASEQGCWRIIRITGAHASTEPEVSSNATGVSTTPDPGSLNPANWDVEDTLWFAVEAADHGNTDAVGFPANYTNGLTDSSGGANGAHLGTARRNNRAASEDPGAFTVDQSEDWTAVTIAVRPAAPAPPARNRAVVISMAMACFVWRCHAGTDPDP